MTPRMPGMGVGITGGWAPHPYFNHKRMDDGEGGGSYGVLRRLYEGKHSTAPRKRHLKSICEEERYCIGGSKLEKAGKKQRVYSIIHRLNVLNLSVLAKEAEKEEVMMEELNSIIADLKSKGLVYEPEPGFLRCAGD